MGRGSIYHGHEGQYSMSRGVDIPWEGGLIYHG